MGRILELMDTLEKLKPMATDAQKAQYKKISDEEDKLEVEKKKLLDQLAKEPDDAKRGKVQDALHKTREDIIKLADDRKKLRNKFRGLTSK